MKECFIALREYVLMLSVIPAHALRILCNHDSGQHGECFDHPLPSFAQTCSMRHDRLSCRKPTQLVMEAYLPPMLGDHLVQWHAAAEGTDGELKRNPSQRWGWTS